MKLKIRKFIGVIVLLLCLSGCKTIFSDTSDSEETRITCDVNYTELESTHQTSTIHIYVDGTPSMQGYVSNRDSQYIRTLNFLESLMSTRGDNPSYYRLGFDRRSGQAVREIERNDYLRATLREFYGSTQFPILAVSQIDEAIAPPENPNTLTIIITDLYQRNDDVTLITQRLREYYLNGKNSGQAVGIIGIRSDFKGSVYTEELSGGREFFYDSNNNLGRPFYVLLIGSFDLVNKYLTAITESLSGDPDWIQATIFSPDALYQAPAILEPLKSSADLMPEHRTQLTIPAIAIGEGQVVVEVHQKPIQLLQILTTTISPPLSFETTLQPTPYVLNIRPDQLTSEVTAYEFDPGRPAIVETTDTKLHTAINLNNFEIASNELSFQVHINSEALSNNNIYLFRANLTTLPNPILEDVDAWENWNGVMDGGKTSNLLSFLEELRALTANVLNSNPPVFGQFCYIIQRR